jgi:hypothetical protein
LGGAVGYFSYDLAWDFEQLPHWAKKDQKLDEAVFLYIRNLIAYDESKKEMVRLFGEEGKVIFETTKPTRLIKGLMFIANIADGDIILDYFAGTATTADAVLQQNAEDGLNRRFIMVQIPEVTGEESEAKKAGYKTIAEISRKRIDLAGEKIKADHKDKLAERETPLDTGFKAFTLDTTNFREWDTNTQNIQDELLAALETFKEGRNSEDALYEVLLKYGVDLAELVELLAEALGVVLQRLHALVEDVERALEACDVRSRGARHLVAHAGDLLRQ